MKKLVEELLHFIHRGTTPFQVVDTIKEFVSQTQSQSNAPFTQLRENETWNLTPGQGYYLTRGGTIICFYLPTNFTFTTPYNIWGAHTDSPALKLRGVSKLSESMGDNKVWGVEIYGSPILNTWLDRPLRIDGRVFVKKTNSQEVEIKNWSSDMSDYSYAVIPNAAIHLNREVNKGFKLNRETQLQAIIPFDLHKQIADDLKIKSEEVISYELFLNDLQEPTLIGQADAKTKVDDSEVDLLIQSPKIDNLAMCHAGVKGLIHAAEQKSELPTIPVLVLFNNEEVGSKSNEGAASIFLSQMLKRISISNSTSAESGHATAKDLKENFWKQLAHSVIISADMAHAYHPSYDHLYGKDHRSYLGKGIVLKRDSNLHYMNDSLLLAQTIDLMKNNGIAYQEYYQHNDIPCGTTIGPHLSSQLGLRTLDLGTAILAMHSIRETGSAKDHASIIHFAEMFYQSEFKFN